MPIKTEETGPNVKTCNNENSLIKQSDVKWQSVYKNQCKNSYYYNQKLG